MIADRTALLAQAEQAPLDFPPSLALELSGRDALSEEEHPGDVVHAICDDLCDWGAMTHDELVASVSDQNGQLVVGADATYDPALVGAIVRGLVRDGFLVEVGGVIDLPGCVTCIDGQGQPDGCGSPTMDACTACKGWGKLRIECTATTPAA